MEAVVVHYRGSNRTRHKAGGNHIILLVKSITTRKASEKLLKKKVTWTSTTGKKITGEIVAQHGNKGAVRAIFERGLPGQSLGGKVEVA